MAGRLAQVNNVIVQFCTMARLGHLALLPCKLDAGRRSCWWTAGRCVARTQFCMMMGHLCGSQSPPAALDTARRWMALDAARWWMEDPWRQFPSSQDNRSMLRCRLFCSTMQTLGPRTASIGGPWLAALQSRNADSMLIVSAHPTCCQPDARRGLSLLMFPYVCLPWLNNCPLLAARCVGWLLCCFGRHALPRRTTSMAPTCWTSLVDHGPEQIGPLLGPGTSIGDNNRVPMLKPHAAPLLSTLDSPMLGQAYADPCPSTSSILCRMSSPSSPCSDLRPPVSERLNVMRGLKLLMSFSVLAAVATCHQCLLLMFSVDAELLFWRLSFIHICDPSTCWCVDLFRMHFSCHPAH